MAFNGQGRLSVSGKRMLCNKGHPMIGHNIGYKNYKGIITRFCRKCDAARSRRYEEKKREKMVRTCRSCSRLMPLNNFPRDSSSGSIGYYRFTCKQCESFMIKEVNHFKSKIINKTIIVPIQRINQKPGEKLAQGMCYCGNIAFKKKFSVWCCERCAKIENVFEKDFLPNYNYSQPYWNKKLSELDFRGALIYGKKSNHSSGH